VGLGGGDEALQLLGGQPDGLRLVGGAARCRLGLGVNAAAPVRAPVRPLTARELGPTAVRKTGR
jgi:hypothetical protein